ncbi:MAG: enoyl-CoA hydratase/isomerase family protein, partial [Gammaproteobacteria bacterium]|nr:enoyl-CoA hydratase/isomerase family protein [Gammaproteobacteria bacterium]
MTAEATVRLEIRDRIAHLTLSRPAAANAMNLAFGREFLDAAVAAAGGEARAILLTGEGRHFCFGGDLKGMLGTERDLKDYLVELTTNLHAGLAHLARAAAPVIAAVNGTAAGAGLGLVLGADLAIAGRSAKFAPAYTGVALTPDAGCTFWLPRVVGMKRAMELFLTNRVLDAEEASALGIVNRVVDDAALAAEAGALAARIAAGPVGAYRRLKRLLAESVSGYEAQLARESQSIAAQGA